VEASPDSSRGGGGSTVLWRVVERDRESEEGESEAGELGKPVRAKERENNAGELEGN